MSVEDFNAWMDRQITLEHQLDGFELDLVGFNCAGEIGPDESQHCPFKPGCGRVPGESCSLMQRLAQIVRSPDRWQ